MTQRKPGDYIDTTQMPAIDVIRFLADCETAGAEPLQGTPRQYVGWAKESDSLMTGRLPPRVLNYRNVTREYHPDNYLDRELEKAARRMTEDQKRTQEWAGRAEVNKMYHSWVKAAAIGTQIPEHMLRGESRPSSTAPHRRDESYRCTAKPLAKRSKYHREIAPGVWVDVYDVLNAWAVNCPALQHLIKKALQPGERGHKGKRQDLADIVASAKRAEELGK